MAHRYIRGVNANSVSLGSQTLQGPGLNFNSNPNNIDYSDGKGWAGYGGIFGEYLSDSWWVFNSGLPLTQDTDIS